MADRISGARQCGCEEHEAAAEYPQKGRVDFSCLNSAGHLQNIQQQKSIWDRHPPKNFNQNFRRACSAYQANQNLSGARCAASESKDSDIDMENSDNVGAEEEESEEELCEFGRFSKSFVLSFSNICLLLLQNKKNLHAAFLLLRTCQQICKQEFLHLVVQKPIWQHCSQDSICANKHPPMTRTQCSTIAMSGTRQSPRKNKNVVTTAYPSDC
jgi:hypothetical protein